MTLVAAAPLGQLKPSSSTRIGEGMWISLPEPFVVPLAESRATEPTDLRLKHPGDMPLEMFEGRWNERDAVTAVEPRAEHQRVASAASGGYSRSPLHRSSQISLTMNSWTSSTYAPSR